MDNVPENPTARALRVLLLLQSHPGITAGELAARLHTTDRAVRRHVATLRQAGVAVESQRGRDGGYRLGRSMQPAPLVFTATEALGLVLAVLDGHHAAADADDPVGSALGKLMSALPARTARQATLVREHARATPDRRAARPDPDVIGMVVAALSEQRAVRIEYTTSDDRSLDIRVDPWALVVRHGRWYLIGNSRDAGSARTYRVDRITQVRILNASAPAPEGLDPVAWLEDHLGSGWKHPVRVHFDAPYEDVAPWVVATMGRLNRLTDHTCELVGSTNNPAMYAGEHLAGVPYAFRLVECPELRDAIEVVARRLQASVESD